MDKSTRCSSHEDGFIMVTMLILIVPLLIAVAAFTTALAGKGGELRTEFDNELALLAAESGVDDAIYRGRIGTLAAGVSYTRDLGSGQSFVVAPTHLKTDGADNDGDGNIDEADEDVFQVVVTGTYRGTTRRLAAYLGPVPLLPTLTSAVTAMDPTMTIDLQGSSRISGLDANINGGAAGGGVPGLSIAAPGTVAHLLSELDATEQTKVVGSSPAPSLDTAPAVDIVTLVDQIKNAANLVLTSAHYSSLAFGDGSAGDVNVTYREGNVIFDGNSRGSGILLVTGNLDMRGTFRFDGVIIVLGSVNNSAGTATIFGSILQGPNGGHFGLRGTSKVTYSGEALALANSVSGNYVTFNGWQEISGG